MVIDTIAGHIPKINKQSLLSFKSIIDKYLELKEIIKDRINEIKKATYNVDINNTFLLCLSFIAFFVATRQLNVVGIPVVVKAIDTIRKLNNTWYIPNPDSPITLERNILYINPRILTIKLDINNTMVDNMRLGTLNKSPPHV